MKKLIFIVVLHVVLLGCGKESEEPAPNFIDGKFVYAAGDIFTKDLNWTNRKQITSDAGFEKYGNYAWYENPLWSQDGNQILCLKSDNGNSSLWLMDKDGDNRVKVVQKDNDYLSGGAGPILTFDWSSDDNWIAYSTYYESGIHIIDLNGQELRTLYENEESQIEYISWSEDSKMIAACTNGGELIIFDVETGEEIGGRHNISGIYSKLYWSPNAEFIVYSTFSVWKIVMFDVVNENEEIIMKEDNPFDLFGWTPDGEYIIYLTGTGKYLDFTALQVSSGQETELNYKSDGWLDYPKGDLFIFE